MVRRRSHGLLESVGFRVARANTRLRSLSLGRRRSTRAFCARAPYHAGYSWSKLCKRPLHRREASLLRRAAVVRHASYSLQESAGFRVARATVTALAVTSEEAQHASFLRAHAVPRWLWSLHVLSKATAPARCLSPVGARPWYGVPATASNAKHAAAREPSAHAPAVAVSPEKA